MISSLPNLNETACVNDVDQTKLAIAILRKISNSITVPRRRQFSQVSGRRSRFRSLNVKDHGTHFSRVNDDDSSGSSYTTADEDHNSEDDNESFSGVLKSCDESFSGVLKSCNYDESVRDKMMMMSMNENFHSQVRNIGPHDWMMENNLPSRFKTNYGLSSNSIESGTMKLNFDLESGNAPGKDHEKQTSLESLEDNLTEISPEGKVDEEEENEEKELGLFEMEYGDGDMGNNSTISVAQLQRIFDAFKVNELPVRQCRALLNLLQSFQPRNDFQWALHQLGGFHSLIFLYARIVEICPNEELQSKALSLTLAQIKHETKLTDSPLEKQRQYHLVRFVLNSNRSIFGFKTFLTLINACLGGGGTQIRDYQLFKICLICSWKNLLRTRCEEEDSPAGERSLFEIFLTIVLELCVENNTLRDLNVGLLKVNGFAERLLAICNSKMSSMEIKQANLSVDDALRIGSLVKSIFLELMAPPDAYISVSLVKFGLLPLLPQELPPLPVKQDAFFVYHQQDEVDPCLEADDSGAVSDDNNTSPEIEFINLNQTETKSRNVQTPKSKLSKKSDIAGSEFSDAFQETLLVGIMNILLNALRILPDGSFHSILSPHMSPHILVAYCSHPNPTLKTLSLSLLSGYLSRVKNPDLTEFVRNKGFALTGLYIQSCPTPEISNVVLNTCQGFGPVSYALAIGLIYNNTVVKNLIQWIQEDEATVVPALLSAGLLPSILNLQTPSNSISRSLSQLLSLVTRYMVLNPKEGPWKVLFCPGIESASPTSSITARLVQDSTEMLRNYRGKDLKKSDASERLLWLLEQSSAAKFGPYFDKWLLNIFAMHVMEYEESEETETWRYFVKKNRKRLHYLMGIFLCKFLAPDKSDFEFKQYAIRFMYMSCPNLSTWLPKVIRRDDQIERCFTSFLRVFFAEVDHRQGGRIDSKFNSPSFQSLVNSNGNLILTLQTAAAVGLPNTNGMTRIRKPSLGQETISDTEIHLSDSAIRSRFEKMLVDNGVLSPSNNFSTSTFSPDFKTFKILIEAPPISGVSYHELKHCITSVEKMKSTLLKSTTYTNMLKIQHPGSNIQMSNSTAYFNAKFAIVNDFAEEILDVLARMRTRQEIEIAKSICRRDHDIVARQKWWKIREQMGHPKAPWHFPEMYPTSWALDQSEGPGRIRLRLKKEHLNIDSRFVKPGHRRSGAPKQPLEYLFQSDSIEFMGYPGIQSEIQLIRSCLRIVPGEENPGEIVVSTTSLHFISEVCVQLCWNRVDVDKSSIRQVLRRRYTLEDRAVEIFVDSRSYFFVFRTFADREALLHQLPPRCGTLSTTAAQLSISTSGTTTDFTPTLSTITSQWVKGLISNFDYLMYLNTAAGRTYNDLMQYPVFPFVLSKYDTSILDLYTSSSYRNLMRPMAIQDPIKEDHFISTYNYLKREGDSAPFHYGSHYSNSGIVLHFLVRLPPFTQHFLKYQDGNFDIPDRSFHSVETMWRLASKESNTDFKEAIPEFYYLPEFLQNLQNFDLGIRQNGVRVDDVTLPPWAKGNPRLFTLINRQALESSQVRNYLSDWIDLIFGHKQTGKAAVQAINVFHPSTYEGFEINGEGTDEVVRRARKAMVSTYGQTPKRLFSFPHPRAQSFPMEENVDLDVLDGITGIQWGNFVGSPASLALDVVYTREFHEQVSLFETHGRVVFWPKQTVIMGDSVVGTWDASGIRIKSNIIYLCIGDEITTCNGSQNSLWIGHHSGRITVLKLSPSLDKVIETIELIGHYQPIKSIDLNQEFSTAISCSGENYVLLWDMNRNSFVNIIEETESIDQVYSSRSTGDIVLLSSSENQIKFKSINGFHIGTIKPDEKIESVCISSLDPGKNVNLIAVGCDYGNIKFYSTWDLKFINQIKIVHLSALAIESIRYSRDGRRLYCLGQSEETFISAALQLRHEN